MRAEQAALASDFGDYGFCYYHYWFNSRRILETPFNEVLNSGEPAFPFCLCWANENWSRRWDGRNQDVLLEQRYHADDDLAQIRAVEPAMRDDRYIRVGDAAVFLVYRVSSHPSPARFAEVWRNEARRLGVGELFLCFVQSFPEEHGLDPRSLGFDAAVEFAPDWSRLGGPLGRGRTARLWQRLRGGTLPHIRDNVYDFIGLWDRMLRKEKPEFPWIRCCTPMWDNSARRESGATILVNSSPEAYQDWLANLVHAGHSQKSDGLLFMNAWNEWAEGCHLEPCRRYGLRYLEATRAGLAGQFSGTGSG